MVTHWYGCWHLCNAQDTLFFLLLAITTVSRVQRATEVVNTGDETFRLGSTEVARAIQEKIDLVRCTVQSISLYVY